MEMIHTYSDHTGRRCFPDPDHPNSVTVDDKWCRQKFYQEGVCKCMPPCKEEIHYSTFSTMTIVTGNFK